MDAAQAKEYEPGVFTYKQALFSPETASLDPLDVLVALKDDLMNAGVDFVFEARFLGRKGNVVRTTQGEYEGRKVINCAGLYADQVAHVFGFGRKYTMLPFKGFILNIPRTRPI